MTTARTATAMTCSERLLASFASWADRSLAPSISLVRPLPRESMSYSKAPTQYSTSMLSNTPSASSMVRWRASCGV